MKTIYLILIIMIAVISVTAQNGEISQEILQTIKKSYDKNNDAIKAAVNAVSNNDIRKITLNRSNAGKTDHYFKYKVDVKGITNQKSSGRCWMFTGLNVLRPKVMKTYNISDFEFSTNYLFFWDQLEKANLFMQAVIENKDKPMDDKTVEWLFKNPIGDGGVWNSLTNLIEKYGAVPKQIMPETHSSENTAWMSRLIRRKLRENGLTLRKMAKNNATEKQLQEKKTQMLADIYKMLAINLGEPPDKFRWRYKDKDGNLSPYKEYTPKDFIKEAVPGLNFDDYVMLMNDPTREYYKLYEIKYDRNIMEGKNWKYINLPAKQIKEYAIESIKDNQAMYASCDVGKQLNKDEGLLATDNYDFESIYGVKFQMTKKDRIMTFESGSTHGMALIAVDVDENQKPTMWQFENSWGRVSGHNGYLTFTDKWFDEYIFRVVVLKKYIDEKTLKILNQKPVELPPWDPMFASDK